MQILFTRVYMHIYAYTEWPILRGEEEEEEEKNNEIGRLIIFHFTCASRFVERTHQCPWIVLLAYWSRPSLVMNNDKSARVVSTSLIDFAPVSHEWNVSLFSLFFRISPRFDSKREVIEEGRRREKGWRATFRDKDTRAHTPFEGGRREDRDARIFPTLER